MREQLDGRREILASQFEGKELKSPNFVSHFAISMLTFYINRTRNSPPGERRQMHRQAKAELRKLFDREQGR